MWWFKKKKEVKLKRKVIEDRFVVEVFKDERRYRINVYDKWSKRFMSDSELDRGKLLCHSDVFDSEENLWVEMKTEVIIEKAKDSLRKDFTEMWNKFNKSKPIKKKSKKKKVK